MALLEQYKHWVESFAEACLRPYLNVIATPTWRVPSAKELNDCVWQTVVLRPFEVIILDSPLLQRLRYVRQLGVAHWTYPGAAHTRFEHSVGALHQLDRLIESLRQKVPRSKEAMQPVPEAAFVNLMRLAALCHDIGHGAMSHVVENAFRRFGTIDELAMELADELQVEEAKLSEAAAYFLMGSAAFKELVDVAQQKTRHELPDDVVVPLRNAILGRPILDRYPLLQELINGPFDADKLDYITRDAHMAGVPVVTDIPRLVQKMRSVEIERANLPAAVARKVRGSFPSYVLYGIALSGGRTLDELMFGRTLLFDKIYRHQKVRATEAMVSSIVVLLARAAGPRAPMLPLLFEDDDLLRLTREGLTERFAEAPSEQGWNELSPARDIALRLKRRQLFVRAFAFAQSMPLDPFRFDDQQRLAFEQFLRDAVKPESRERITSAIIAELKRMRTLLPDAWPEALEATLSAYIVVDPPDSFGHPKEISRANLVTDDQQVVPFREDSAESPAWSAAYLMTRDLGYIFTPVELATATFLAAELAVRILYNVRTPRSAHDYAKVKSGPLSALRKALTEKGYYSGLPNDLRAEPERLQKADIDTRIASVVQKLGSYEGLSPASTGHPRPVRIDAVRVRTWLRQFRSDAEADAALDWLERIKIVARQDVHDALRAFMSEHKDLHGAWVCPLGAPKDSSAIVTYYVSDLAGAFDFRPSTLAEALGTPGGKPILFVDDFISTGAQARTILCQWMGDEASPLNEAHVAALSESQRAELRSRRLGFLFVAGDPDGKKALLDEALRLKLNAVGGVHIPSGGLPRAFKNERGQDAAVRERANEIGRQLLRTAQPGKSDDWIAERALGYGGHGYLLAFPYNTPTQTLTLLWRDGKVDGWQWLPLIPRRAKD
jgi:deoxynucleoside triphosphate triphosphohydrolase SAMHD1